MIRGRSRSSSVFLRSLPAVYRAFVCAFAVVVLAGPRAHAGQIWTDGDADGLPDNGATLTASPGQVVSLDIWIDSQAFEWTNFLVYAEWGATCFSYVSAQYLLTDGTNFPIDRFSHPAGVGFGGFTYNRSGVDAIGRVNLRLTAPMTCCITPIIDIYNPYGVFSQLGQGESYFLFSSNPGSCWDPSGSPQACCFPNGSCAVLPPAECAAAGGVWQGAGTTCATVSCPPPPPAQGACCYPSGACTSFLTRTACEGGGGAYQGDGTSCATVSCPQPTGACCLASGACSQLSRDECEASGGTYRGDGVTCAAANCPQPTGACCFPNGSCLIRTASQCSAQGGVYQGNGVTCAAANCPQPPTGACCLPSGSCLIRTPSECNAIGGIYQGNGVSCASADCPASPQACCFTTGECEDLESEDCSAQGGDPQGQGSTCVQTSCIPPKGRGACCLGNGDCAPSMIEAECSAAGGIYMGDGTICGVVECGDSRIWTDADGDGLPDFDSRAASLGDSVFADLWIDAGDFAWTNYLAYVEWPNDCFDFEGAEYAIMGGSNFPIDNFSHPSAFGFGGSGFNEGGVDRIGRFTLRATLPVACCVTPIIDPKNAYYVFSQLGAGSAYRLFANNSGSCWDVAGPPPIGACCFPALETCEDTTQAACVAMGGIYQGANTSCANSSCPAFGACCFSSLDTCTDTTQTACNALGGAYQGDGTTCAVDSCPPATGACCTPDSQCVETTETACTALGGFYSGDGTRCSSSVCPLAARGACCVADSCYAPISPVQCAALGGVYRGNGSICQPNSCDESKCGSFAAPGTVTLLRERFGPARAPKAEGAPCLLTGNTNGTAANYRWYNVCSGYIWIYSGWVAGEGVGVLFGGASNTAVSDGNNVKRTITYYRNVCPNYNQTVDVYLDNATSSGCLTSNIASDLNLDPGLRWNCSEFNSRLCGISGYVAVRTQHDGGYSPTFATDGPFANACDPNPLRRSYYYGLNGSACIPWAGRTDVADNFLSWLILDAGEPCYTAVERTSWGKIKGLFR